VPFHRVSEYVKSYDPGLEPLLFKEKMKTSLEAAEVLGVEVGQIAKSILFTSNDQFALFVASGDLRIDMKKVKQLMGGKPRIASPEEVLRVTGFEVGAVCPFALQHDIPIYIDESLNRFDRVYTAAGIASHSCR